jgi:hypothetical protein
VQELPKKKRGHSRDIQVYFRTIFRDGLTPSFNLHLYAPHRAGPHWQSRYHFLNRGNPREQVFFRDGDSVAFMKALAHATV